MQKRTPIRELHRKPKGRRSSFYTHIKTNPLGGIKQIDLSTPQARQELKDKFYPTEKYVIPEEEALYWKAERKLNGDHSDLNQGFLNNSGFDISDKKDTGFITYWNSNQLPAVWSGWKVHLSVAAKDVPRATAIIAEISLRHTVQEFKVTRPPQTKEFSVEHCPQTGKNFTLYDSGNENWPKIIMEIETRFRASGIAPSHPVRSDKQIKGSSYAYYRNDLNPETGKYIGAQYLNSFPEDLRHNPFRQKDPFQNIDVGQCPHQPKPCIDKKPEETIANMAWDSFRSTRFGFVMRTEAPDGEAQRILITEIFRNLGVCTRIITSTTDGKDYIQVSNPDEIQKVRDILAKQIQKQRKDHPHYGDGAKLVAPLEWKCITSPDHGEVYRADVNTLSTAQRIAIYDYLHNNDLTSAKMVGSKTFGGTYVQVAASELPKLVEVWKKLGFEGLKDSSPNNANNIRPLETHIRHGGISSGKSLGHKHNKPRL